jgi:hypothetical protein
LAETCAAHTATIAALTEQLEAAQSAHATAAEQWSKQEDAYLSEAARMADDDAQTNATLSATTEELAALQIAHAALQTNAEATAERLDTTATALATAEQHVRALQVHTHTGAVSL